MAAEAPLVCRLDALTAEERRRHQSLTSELVGEARGVDELAEGWALRLTGGSPTFLRVAEWVALERACCPFLAFTLALSPAGETRLLLSGPPGVREFLRAELGLAGGGKPPRRSAPPEHEATLGPLEPEEREELLALLARCGLPAAGVEDHLSSGIAARFGGRLVGSAVLELYGEVALLRSVAVDAERRGSGLGTRLTHAALELARERGATRVFLLTETAGGFFPKLGFRAVDRGSAPAVLSRSREFAGACCPSAQLMERAL